MHRLFLPRFYVVLWLIIILFYFTTDFISPREVIFLSGRGSLLNNINMAIRCTEEEGGLIGIYHWNCKSIYIIVMGYAHEMHMKCECM